LRKPYHKIPEKSAGSAKGAPWRQRLSPCGQLPANGFFAEEPSGIGLRGKRAESNAIAGAPGGGQGEPRSSSLSGFGAPSCAERSFSTVFRSRAFTA
jgi:hypothetical protein